MEFHHLPVRTSDAAGNMAADLLLLQRYPQADAARFRHYEWPRPAFTFGYAQKIAFVRERLPAHEKLDLTRRSTGGGLVDHREDWTYALVVPRKHPLFDRPGPFLYHVVHEALAGALNELGSSVRLQREPPQMAPGVCFERPEIDDVVRTADGTKVAGAAMKRNKHGILLQGSIWRPFAGAIDWSRLDDSFAAALAAALELAVERPGWPSFNPDEEEALIAQYASPEWIESR